jgi:hypothetical protein
MFVCYKKIVRQICLYVTRTCILHKLCAHLFTSSLTSSLTQTLPPTPRLASISIKASPPPIAPPPPLPPTAAPPLPRRPRLPMCICSAASPAARCSTRHEHVMYMDVWVGEWMDGLHLAAARVTLHASLPPGRDRPSQRPCKRLGPPADSVNSDSVKRLADSVPLAQLLLRLLSVSVTVRASPLVRTTRLIPRRWRC